MLDLREAFHHLGRQVTDLPRPPASQVRAGVERRRRSSIMLVMGASMAVAVSGAWAFGMDRLSGITDGIGVTTASSRDLPQPWLPQPWNLEESGTLNWVGGSPSPMDLCGSIILDAHDYSVERKLFARPSGREAQIYVFEAGRNDLIQLFKFIYANCLESGAVVAVSGPRNLWSYEGTQGGAHLESKKLIVVILNATDGARIPTRDDVSRLLDQLVVRLSLPFQP